MVSESVAIVLAGFAAGLVQPPQREAPSRPFDPPLRVAQYGLPSNSGPSYGYQPYNDRNPTGFYHPNGMGYGSYYMTPKYHGHRIPSLHYRKFRGN